MRRRSSIGLLVAVALAGCGGDDGAGTTSGTKAGESAPAKPGYVAQADAICREANEAEAALGADGIGWIYTEQFDDAEFLADFKAIGESALRDLRKLTPPPGDEALATAALDSIDRMVAALDERVANLRAGKDTRSAAQIREYDLGYKDLAVAAGPLGLSECQGLLV